MIGPSGHIILTATWYLGFWPGPETWCDRGHIAGDWSHTHLVGRRYTPLAMEIRYHHVDREQTAFGELVLRRFEAENGESGYEIVLDGSFLMATHGYHSERLMAQLAWDRLPTATRADLRVLIGGLGAGHTLRAVLDLAGVTRVTVAEIGTRVVAWNRAQLAPHNGHAIDDPRVEIVVDDVAALIAARPEAFDLVLLDIDNGPGWLASPANAALYQPAGLTTCRRALRPNGVLAIWSPGRNHDLEQNLERELAGWEAADTSDVGRREREPGAIVYLWRCRP